MTAESQIDYEALAQDAMRGIVRTVLERVARSGLPGEHHFYIAFSTEAPGVVVSKRLKQKYPEEMTVVLQHRFWDLTVTEERFEVKLTFDGIPERLSVPFTAVKVFFDPSVPYGLQFEGSDLAEDASPDGTSRPEADDSDSEPATTVRDRSASLRTGLAEKKPRAVRKPRADKSVEPAAEAPAQKAAPKHPAASADPGAAANDAKVVSLDKFRKK